jgi:phosphohistidine phosphatase
VPTLPRYPRPMLLLLIRHAHADEGEPDELRPLSERGREEARTLATQLAGRDVPPAVVLTSPLLRARQTAEQIGQSTGAPVRIDDRLAPGATADALRQAVDGAETPVAVVGHQPDCSEIAFELTGSDPGFPTAGVAEIELQP